MITQEQLNIIMDKESDEAFKRLITPINSEYAKYIKEVKKLISNFHIDLGKQKFDTKNPTHRALLDKLNKDVNKLTNKLFKTIKRKFDITIDKHYDFCFNKTKGSLPKVKDIDDLTYSAIKNTDIENPWSGIHYRDRLKEHNNRLNFTTKSILSSSITQGEDAIKNYSHIHKSLESQIRALDRLMKTELHVCRVQSQLSCYEANGIREVRVVKSTHKYEKVHTMRDGLVCKKCKEHERKVIRLKDRKPGVNVPSFHPHCRCWCEPIIIHEVKKLGEE